MRVIATTLKQNRDRIAGKHTVSGNHGTVSFEMRHGFSWNQWGNTTEVLGVCVAETERLCNEWLEKRELM